MTAHGAQAPQISRARLAWRDETARFRVGWDSGQIMTARVRTVVTDEFFGVQASEPATAVRCTTDAEISVTVLDLK